MATNQVRAGLYVSFIENAVQQISGGARGIVAIPLKTYDTVTATAKTFYTITTETEAVEKFGAANVKSILRALQGGAKEVLVYTLPTIDGVVVTEAQAYTEARDQFETRPFHVFAFDGEISDTEQDATKTWLIAKREEGKHFFFITGGTEAEDQTPATGNSRSARLEDDYIINLISGVLEDGAVVSSGDFAGYIAGLVASTPINQSITYAEMPVEDVAKRLRKVDTETAITSGSLVLFHDGEVVRVEMAITTSGKKVRAMASRQAVATDIKSTANKNFIGKLPNTVDSRKALLSSISAYLERLEGDNVLTDIEVGEDTQNPSTGDTVNIVVSYTEISSMEKINVGVVL